MGFIADEIENTASELGIKISKLHTQKTQEIRTQLAERFSQEPKFPGRLSYQNLKEWQSIDDPESWSFIEDYVGEEEIILFVNSDQEKDMWLIRSGSDLTYLIGEMFGFPFYVTSPNADYLLCADDHDCLIGCGKAMEWICQLRDNGKLL